MSSPDDTLDFFVPVYDAIPNDWQEAREFLVEQLRMISEQVNARTNGYYFDAEQLSGSQLFPTTNNELRGIFRKIVPLIRTDVGGSTPGLNNFGTTNPQNVAHGITTTANTQLIKLFGAASDPAAATLNLGIPLPYVDNAGAADIQLSMDATNIILTGTGDYSAFSSAFVIVEYIQEA